MTTQERIVRVVQTVAQKPLPTDPEESLFESGVLDSFALPDMISGLEREFGIAENANDAHGEQEVHSDNERLAASPCAVSFDPWLDVLKASCMTFPFADRFLSLVVTW